MFIPRGFDEIVFPDFEFSQPPGCVPRVVSVCAREAVSGRSFRMFLDEGWPSEPPRRTDRRCLYAGYALAAEMSAHLSLGWKLPNYLLDLFFEFRWLTNDYAERRGLLDACEHKDVRLPPDRRSAKREMRDLAIRWFDRPRTAEERRALLGYIQEDVDDTIRAVRGDAKRYRLRQGNSLPWPLRQGRGADGAGGNPH